MLNRLLGRNVWVGLHSLAGVRERDGMRKDTTSALRGLGLEPTIYSLIGAQAEAERLLREGSARCSWVLFVEDDILIDAPTFLGATRAYFDLPQHTGTVFAGFLPGKSFYPASVKRTLSSHRLFKTINQRNHFGSQLLLMPREIAQAAVAAMQRRTGNAANIDMVIRDVADLYSYVPNPVQHRCPRSIWSPHGRPQRSISYAPER